ncbi:uncharacterized protein MONOS_4600 [Monocercomonoides exilis]|uniref:uncharacterized protein n=1 Tax=Monocercomonoides exilis TaxID=2049356 RepID=UPI0035595E4F|nr:hypothetical protein MONOS_4600 [Monocercomonoides exilis]
MIEDFDTLATIVSREEREVSRFASFIGDDDDSLIQDGRNKHTNSLRGNYRSSLLQKVREFESESKQWEIIMKQKELSSAFSKVYEEGNPDKILDSLRDIRKYTAKYNLKDIDTFIQDGIIEKFVHLLQTTASQQIQSEILWIVTKQNHNVRKIAFSGIVPCALSCLGSNDRGVVSNAIWLLSNIVTESTDLNCFVQTENSLQKIFELFERCLPLVHLRPIDFCSTDTSHSSPTTSPISFSQQAMQQEPVIGDSPDLLQDKPTILVPEQLVPQPQSSGCNISNSTSMLPSEDTHTNTSEQAHLLYSSTSTSSTLPLSSTSSSSTTTPTPFLESQFDPADQLITPLVWLLTNLTYKIPHSDKFLPFVPLALPCFFLKKETITLDLMKFLFQITCDSEETVKKLNNANFLRFVVCLTTSADQSLQYHAIGLLSNIAQANDASTLITAIRANVIPDVLPSLRSQHKQILQETLFLLSNILFTFIDPVVGSQPFNSQTPVAFASYNSKLVLESNSYSFLTLLSSQDSSSSSSSLSSSSSPESITNTSPDTKMSISHSILEQNISSFPPQMQTCPSPLSSTSSFPSSSSPSSFPSSPHPPPIISSQLASICISHNLFLRLKQIFSRPFPLQVKYNALRVVEALCLCGRGIAEQVIASGLVGVVTAQLSCGRKAESLECALVALNLCCEAAQIGVEMKRREGMLLGEGGERGGMGTGGKMVDDGTASSCSNANSVKENLSVTQRIDAIYDYNAALKEIDAHNGRQMVEQLLGSGSPKVRTAAKRLWVRFFEPMMKREDEAAGEEEGEEMVMTGSYSANAVAADKDDEKMEVECDEKDIL